MATKVIVVDDSRTARLQIRMALSGAGYDIVDAVDGKDGLAQIDAHADAALVLCDINMPNMDGLEMLECLRGSRRAMAHLPVVMLTTEAQPELVRRAKDAGARGWIVKPFKPELLVAAVRKLTSRQDQ